MGCTTCGGSRKRLKKTSQSFLSGSKASLLAEDIKLVTVVYLSSNMATHVVYSRCRPSTSDGGVISDYGRHRGASLAELTAFTKSDAPVELAKTMGIYGRCVFEIAMCDYEERETAYMILVDNVAIEKIEVDSVDVSEDVVSFDITTDITLIGDNDVKYLSKTVIAKLASLGYTTEKELVTAWGSKENQQEISSAFVGSKTVSAPDKAKIVVEGLRV